MFGFLIFILAGLICGLIDSTLGMGFGVSITSVLVTFGFNPALASASIHTAEGFVDTASAISHYKFGNIRKELFWWLTIPGIFGAVCGALLLSWLVISMMRTYVSGVLFIMGLLILLRFIFIKTVSDHPSIPKRLIPLLGFGASFIDVSGGGGWGPLCVPIFVLGGYEPREAVGTVEATEPIISFTAVIVFGLVLGFESFSWWLIIPLILGGFILTPIGAYLSRHIPKRLLGVLIGLVLVVLNLRTILLSLF